MVPNTPTTTVAASALSVKLRPDRAQRDLAPGHVDREQHRGIGQQRQRQPFQEEDVAVVGHEHLQHKRREHEQRRHQVAIDAGDQLRHLAHRGDVGGDVERIGDQQQQHDALQHDRRERRLDVGGQPLAGDAADARADRLDRRHQRIGQRHRPQHVEAELRAGLGIGGDAAGIVVGDAGDQARPQPRQRMLLQAVPQTSGDRPGGGPGGPELFAPHWLRFRLEREASRRIGRPTRRRRPNRCAATARRTACR